jgi:hypothetical protein
MVSLSLMNNKQWMSHALTANLSSTGLVIALAVTLAGCAVQSPPITPIEAPQNMAAQKAAQQAVLATAPQIPTLKRKIALGRISNETSYGQSLLRDNSGDPLGKQVTDLMSKALTLSVSVRPSHLAFRFSPALSRYVST